MRRFSGAAAVLVAAIALSGCATSAGGGAPYPRGSWPAADQNTFLAACDVVGGTAYCACALGDDMQNHPDATSIRGGFANRGREAGIHQERFTDCANL